MILVVGKVVDQVEDSNKTVYKVFKLLNMYTIYIMLYLYFQITDDSGTVGVIIWKNSIEQKTNKIIGSMVKCHGYIRSLNPKTYIHLIAVSDVKMENYLLVLLKS